MTSPEKGSGGESADAAKRQLDDVAETVKADAASAKADAMARAETEAERQKDMGAVHLDAFADAVRKAADELGEQDKSAAAQFVREAAGGLESLSSSLREKSVGDLVDNVSRFGRTNPTAFLGGALLAGVALGRFAQASGERSHGSGGAGYRSGFRAADGHGTSSASGDGTASPGPATALANPSGQATVSPAGTSGHAAAARPLPAAVNAGGTTDATR